MPRLLKLFDITKITNMIKSFTNSDNTSGIIQEYFILYFYRIVRLIMIAIICMYFLGCIWYYISLNYKEYANNGQLTSWYLFFDVGDRSEAYQVIFSQYFALTLLSTVGYGGESSYPINSLERLLATVLMLLAVGFFSYIMSSI